MSFGKSINQCKKCVSSLPKRQFGTGTPNTLDSDKITAKGLILNQIKLITQLKAYLSKVTNDLNSNSVFDNALNKEFAHFLQKIQPKVYGTDVIRYFETVAPAVPEKTEKTLQSEDNSGPSITTIPSILNELMGIKSAKNEEKPIPKWKLAKSNQISKESISSRTNQLLSSLITTEKNLTKLSKIESLIEHLKRYPEAKHNAVKDGAIRMLLRMKLQTHDENVENAIREAFALLGHIEPVPGNGVRILSIDGGGVRGIMVIEMLRKLEELSGQSVHEMFDLICGVSTGAILATLLGLKQKTLDEVSEIYKTISTQVFTQSTLKGTSNLVWSHSYYDTALWEKLLKDQWGDLELVESARNPKCPKFCAVSAVVNQARLAAYVFRNYSLPCRVQSQYLGGHRHKIWESVRASAAAPTYFEEFKLGNMLHQDGGILVNNPTAVAIHEAKLLWPQTPIQCVVSFGTGRTAPNPIDNSEVSNSSWKNKFFAILDSATDTEGVHTMLSDLLPKDVYYRFNPYLTEMLNMAEIQPQKIEQMERDALMYLRRNEDTFQDAAKCLSGNKSSTRRMLDWVYVQKQLYGFNQD